MEIAGRKIAALQPIFDGRIMRRLALRFTLTISLLLLVSALFGATWGYLQLTGSLPQLDGEVFIDGVSAAVIVERDGLGVPTIRAANRTDLAYATGFCTPRIAFSDGFAPPQFSPASYPSW